MTLLFIAIKNKIREEYGTREFPKKTRIVSVVFTNYDFYRVSIVNSHVFLCAL